MARSIAPDMWMGEAGHGRYHVTKKSLAELKRAGGCIRTVGGQVVPDKAAARKEMSAAANPDKEVTGAGALETPSGGASSEPSRLNFREEA